MPCTTILVGKDASYDGSTIIARNDDSPNGEFAPKRMGVVLPKDQPRHYRSVISHVEVDLSDVEPQRYTCVPNALTADGIWAAGGINECNVAMTASETITSNARVLGADPLVALKPAVGVEGEEGYVPEVPGGIGEEDIVTLVLPYICSAREGVKRLGSLLERYGTYEMNGVGFADLNEIWWLETIGGHHWIARRVPDDSYVTMPNQLGIDSLDLSDAEGDQKEHMCSSDLRSWMTEHHLDRTVRKEGDDSSVINPRVAFGSLRDSDHVYNTPRAWSIQRRLNPRSNTWDGADADYTPISDDIPWARRPERLVTIEDVKDVLSLHYQGTPFDCYDAPRAASRLPYRPIGVNRTDHLSIIQLRPYAPQGARGIHWIAFGSNVFNTVVPLFAAVNVMPEYLANTTATVSTDNFYWASRMVGALADPHFNTCAPHVERYQLKAMAAGHALIHATDQQVAQASGEQVTRLLEAANERMARDLRKMTDELLSNVLFTSSMGMRNSFARSDG